MKFSACHLIHTAHTHSLSKWETVFSQKLHGLFSSLCICHGASPVLRRNRELLLPKMCENLHSVQLRTSTVSSLLLVLHYQCLVDNTTAYWLPTRRLGPHRGSGDKSEHSQAVKKEKKDRKIRDAPLKLFLP